MKDLKINNLCIITKSLIILGISFSSSSCLFAQYQVENGNSGKLSEAQTTSSQANGAVEDNKECESIADQSLQLDCYMKHIDNITEELDLPSEINSSGYIPKLSTEMEKQLNNIDEDRKNDLLELTALVLQKDLTLDFFNTYNSELDQINNMIIKNIENIKQQPLDDNEIKIYRDNLKAYLNKAIDLVYLRFQTMLVIEYDKKLTNDEIKKLIVMFSDDAYKKFVKTNMDLYLDFITRLQNSDEKQTKKEMIKIALPFISDILKQAESSKNDISNDLKSSGYEYDYLEQIKIPTIKDLMPFIAGAMANPMQPEAPQPQIRRR